MPMVAAISPHDTSGQFDWLFRIYVALTVAVTVLVVGAILYAALRFRRRSDRWPAQRKSAPKLEAVYVTVIALIVVGLLTATFRTENQVDALTAHPALRVRVTAFQWQWRFDYPSAGISLAGRGVGSTRPAYARLVVPAGRPVEFTMRSTDVLHNFYIPAMRFKRYAFPNYTNRFVLTFPRPGRLLGECAQFCGWDHAEMRFMVVVLPESRFRAWMAAHARGAAA
jgi:cytochrome c oxidase subunit II